MKFLILIGLFSFSFAEAEQHDFGNGNCRGCGGSWGTDSTTGLWVCSPGPAGPLEICGDAHMGPTKVAIPLVTPGGTKATTLPSKTIVK